MMGYCFRGFNFNWRFLPWFGCLVVCLVLSLLFLVVLGCLIGLFPVDLGFIGGRHFDDFVAFRVTLLMVIFLGFVVGCLVVFCVVVLLFGGCCFV